MTMSPTCRLMILALCIGLTGASAVESPSAPRSVLEELDAGRIWTAADYRKLNEAIIRRSLSLPRLDDPASSAVFARAVNPKNYEELLVTGDLPTRLRAAGALHAPVTQLFGAYVKAYDTQNAPVQNEVAQLYDFLIGLTARCLPLGGS